MSQPRTVILVGAGHVHLYIAARAEAFVERGVRLVLIDASAFWYSGLATGMLGGEYQPAEDQVDPQALIEAHGGEFIRDWVDRVDVAGRRLYLAGGGDLSYDYLSINVGSRVNLNLIDGAARDSSVWSVKPISNLWRLREHLERQFQLDNAPRVVVVGGGPTGSEIAANLTALARRHAIDLPVTLVTSGDRLIKQAPAGAARSLREILTQRGVIVRTHTRIVRREPGVLIIADDGRIDADLVVLAVGLEANSLVDQTGLPARAKSGLRVNACLNSIADERVFAGGDCAAMEGFDLPKLGVFGVRQAAYIHANLLARLDGCSLIEYVPQKRYLAILNLGDGTGMSTWGPFWWRGRSSMWLKDFVDRRFLQKFQQR